MKAKVDEFRVLQPTTIRDSRKLQGMKGTAVNLRIAGFSLEHIVSRLYPGTVPSEYDKQFPTRSLEGDETGRSRLFRRYQAFKEMVEGWLEGLTPDE